MRRELEYSETSTAALLTVGQESPGLGDENRSTLPTFVMNTPTGSVAGYGPLSGVTEDNAQEIARHHGAVAAGLIPFDPSGPCQMIVPERWIARGTTAVGDKAPLGAARATHTPAMPGPIAVRGLDNPGYREAVGRAVARINDGLLDKVVLSRLLELEYASDRPLDAAAVYRALCAQHPRAYVFSVADAEGPGLTMGASPELVMSVRDGFCTTHPLAGSASRHGAVDATEDAQIGEQLMRSAKDRAEHATVVDDIATRLEPLCDELSVPPTPSLLATPQLWHLGTRITGKLKPGVTSLDAARAIHPTPAICGAPRDAALAVIDEAEPHDRGFFGGLVGWTDVEGNGEWALNLRSARVSPTHATLFAGAGIVAGSDPDSEHRETGTKLSTFLAALGLDPEARRIARAE